MAANRSSHTNFKQTGSTKSGESVPDAEQPTGLRAKVNAYNPVSLSTEQIWNLLSPFSHSPHLRRHRVALILNRVQIMAALFAGLIPLWIMVDVFVYPFPEWLELAGLRVLSVLILLAIAWPWSAMRTQPAVTLLLVVLLAVPPVFYLISIPILSGVQGGDFATILTHLYGLLPFTVVAGLCVFPLTLFEVLVLSVPVFLVTSYGNYLQGASLADMVGNLWMLVLITGASLISGMSQLHYIVALVNRAAFDPLTNAFTRRTGTETLDLQFRLASMQKMPLTVLFVDLDHFKSINDDFGHQAGDAALQQVANRLQALLRRGDALVRWGGEEFLVILPDTDADGAEVAVDRLLQKGFDHRPDGTPLTASIGVCERIRDGVFDWPEMVALADERMYDAKHHGRNRVCFWDEKIVLGHDV